jgi:hypothetical protein
MMPGQGGNFDRDLQKVEAVRRRAARKGGIPARVPLARLQHRGEGVVPIPGTPTGCGRDRDRSDGSRE